MAVLKWRWRAIPGPLALACLAGCLIHDALVKPTPPFAFNHRVHVEDEEIGCVECHGRWDDDEDPGMPKAAQCALCHNSLDEEKPPERRVSNLIVDGKVRASHVGRQSPEIVFSHLSHATREGTDCVSCHEDIAKDDGSLVGFAVPDPMSMDACVACHAETTGPPLSDCAACHSEIRAGVEPPSHRADWMRFHGSIVRGRSEDRVDQCALCHQESSCTMCHQVMPPENHTNFWRRRGHGLTASMDRASCMTCHESDSCRRCHEEIRPMSHTGSWGEPRDRHCLGCHEPLRNTSCGVCHDGTPSHEMATPLPPDHNAGMNCRMCHGNGQPLPHVDNGQQCTSCHQ
jgi:hypothetical protein